METLSGMSIWEAEAVCRLQKSFIEDRWSKAGLVSLLKVIELEADLVSVSEYAKAKKISTQGARKFRDLIRISSLQLLSLRYV